MRLMLRIISFLALALILIVLFGTSLWLLKSHLDLWARPNRIGVLEIRGVITEAESPIKSLKAFRKDSNIRAILIRIESPGGGVGPCQEIYRELIRTRQHKPVVASLGGIAASGGYYIASAATRIIASPGTLTGSIGVVVHFPNLKGLFKKIGYSMVTIKSGQFKDSGNPARDMTPGEKELFQSLADEVHKQFIRDVSRGRKLPLPKLQKVADGRIISGEKAVQLGLVDQLGNFEDAVETAARLGHIKGEPKLIYAEREKSPILRWLLGKIDTCNLLTFFDMREPLRYQFVP